MHETGSQLRTIDRIGRRKLRRPLGGGGGRERDVNIQFIAGLTNRKILPCKDQSSYRIQHWSLHRLLYSKPHSIFVWGRYRSE
jgi:hypothetical protein